MKKRLTYWLRGWSFVCFGVCSGTASSVNPQAAADWQQWLVEHPGFGSAPGMVGEAPFGRNSSRG